MRWPLTREQKGANVMTISILSTIPGSDCANSQHKTLLVYLLLFGFSLLSLNATAEGATFCVSNTQQLQNALTTAASNGENDIINVVQGVYEGNFLYASTEAHDITLRGGFNVGCGSRVADAEDTVLDAGASGSVLALSAPLQYVNFVVDALTLQNGAVIGKPGGGLYMVNHGNCVLTNSIISNNSSDTGAGGLYMVCDQTARITNCSFVNNHSEGFSWYEANGGANVFGETSVTVNDSRFINNTSGGYGGGLYARLSNYEVRNNTFVNNSARYGGGAYLGSGTLANNTFTGNTATVSGGGVYSIPNDDHNGILRNNIIDGNSAWQGGGMYISGRQPNLINNTIINNFTTNTDPESSGGGLFYVSDEHNTNYICNNIFWGNSSAKGSDICFLNDANQNYLSSQINLLNNNFDQSAGGIYIQIPFSIDSSNLNHMDPLFVASGNSDFRLQTISPCIDAGNNFTLSLPPTDIDGNPRIVNSTVDMGAYEYQGSAQYTLTVNANPPGAWGSVTRDPNKPTYDFGDVVTLTAAANPGYSFAGWSGDLTGSDNPGTITMRGSKTVAAHFRRSTKIVLLTPNGGEVIPSASTYPIFWGAPSEAVRFSLFYSLNNGATWKLITEHVTETSFYWQVPELYSNTKACRVKVVSYDNAGKTLGLDKSDRVFTIKVITLMWPKDGDLLVSGSDCNIIWETNALKPYISTVSLYYTKDGGTTWIRIDTSSMAGNPGRFVWKIPFVSARKTRCKIKVVRKVTPKVFPNDVTDRYFTIQPAP